jgi:hypothetical protein
VVLVGMHRSGTSATAGALGALGLQVPRSEDRMDSPSSNPEHWESHALMLHNDDVLNILGGSWDAPPELAAGWEHGPEMSLVSDPAPLVGAAYPDAGPLVWKDPRVCLLLPYWRLLIPGSPTAVFVWRPPMAVARSLQARDHLTLEHGLALWERYNLAALEGLRGMDVFVIDYESLMADHDAAIGEVAGWLGALEQFTGLAGAWDVDRAVSLVVDGLRHQPADDDSGHLLSEHGDLVERMSVLRGGHRQFDPGPPADESPWTTDLLSIRRASRPLAGRVRDLEVLDEARRQEVAELRAELGASRYALEQSERTLLEHQQVLKATHAELEKFVRIVDNMHESTSWKVTKPLRTVTAKVQRGQARSGDSG